MKILLLITLLTTSLFASSNNELLMSQFYANKLIHELGDERKNLVSLIGLADTVHMCSVSASESAYKISNRNNIVIKRVSLNPRNIGLSAADVWEQKALLAII
ncbi:hypothetical protein, partial [uncultured Gammaproteobacteria bacterium]